MCEVPVVKRYAMFGDSILDRPFGSNDSPTSTPESLLEYSNYTLIKNCSVPGIGWGRVYGYETVQNLAVVDCKNVIDYLHGYGGLDGLIFMSGWNDWARDIPLTRITQSINELGYFISQINDNKIQNQKTPIEVVVITPTYTTDESANGVGATLGDYRTTIASAASGFSNWLVLNGTELVDETPAQNPILYYNGGPHLTDEGQERLCLNLTIEMQYHDKWTPNTTT